MLSAVLAFALFVGVCQGAPGGSRIVNGTATSVEAYPSIVQVEGLRWHRWDQNCGATIVSNLIVISAAHCFHLRYDPLFNPNARRIRAGATYHSQGGVVAEIASYTNHPDFDVETFMDADINIVRLRTPLIFGSTISSIAIIPQDFDIPDNAPVIWAGWGNQWFSGPRPDVLQQITVNNINHDFCRERFGRNRITKNMICSGILEIFGFTPCNGDSGGPLYYGGVLAGIISWGEGCGHIHYPGVSTRVASYTNWILANSN